MANVVASGYVNSIPRTTLPAWETLLRATPHFAEDWTLPTPDISLGGAMDLERVTVAGATLVNGGVVLLCRMTGQAEWRSWVVDYLVRCAPPALHVTARDGNLDGTETLHASDATINGTDDISMMLCDVQLASFDPGQPLSLTTHPSAPHLATVATLDPMLGDATAPQSPRQHPWPVQLAVVDLQAWTFLRIIDIITLHPATLIDYYDNVPAVGLRNVQAVDAAHTRFLADRSVVMPLVPVTVPAPPGCAGGSLAFLDQVLSDGSPVVADDTNNARERETAGLARVFADMGRAGVSAPRRETKQRFLFASPTDNEFYGVALETHGHTNHTQRWRVRRARHRILREVELSDCGSSGIRSMDHSMPNRCVSQVFEAPGHELHHVTSAGDGWYVFLAHSPHQDLWEDSLYKRARGASEWVFAVKLDEPDQGIGAHWGWRDQPKAANTSPKSQRGAPERLSPDPIVLMTGAGEGNGVVVVHRRATRDGKVLFTCRHLSVLRRAWTPRVHGCLPAPFRAAARAVLLLALTASNEARALGDATNEHVTSAWAAWGALPAEMLELVIGWLWAVDV